jgi:hypothetical protein
MNHDGVAKSFSFSRLFRTVIPANAGIDCLPTALGLHSGERRNRVLSNANRIPACAGKKDNRVFRHAGARRYPVRL